MGPWFYTGLWFMKVYIGIKGPLIERWQWRTLYIASRYTFGSSVCKTCSRIYTVNVDFKPYHERECEPFCKKMRKDETVEGCFSRFLFELEPLRIATLKLGIFENRRLDYRRLPWTEKYIVWTLRNIGSSTLVPLPNLHLHQTFLPGHSLWITTFKVFAHEDSDNRDHDDAE